MDQNTFDILNAASSGDYKKLKSLPRIENYKEAENVEKLIRNMVIRNLDSRLLRSYPIKYKQALLDYSSNPKIFRFLVKNLVGPRSKFGVDIPSYVFEKVSKECLAILVEYNQFPIFSHLSDENKIYFINIFKDTELNIPRAIDILEYVAENFELSCLFSNKYVDMLSDFGYNPPKRKSKEDNEDLIYRWIRELRKELENLK